jgi:hypothetical protein
MTIHATVCGISSALVVAQSSDSRVPVTGGQLGRMLLWTAVLLFVFLVGSFAIHRFSRRYRAYLLRKPASPTASEDVWRMHRLPEEWDEEKSP